MTFTYLHSRYYMIIFAWMWEEPVTCFLPIEYGKGDGIYMIMSHKMVFFTLLNSLTLTENKWPFWGFGKEEWGTPKTQGSLQPKASKKLRTSYSCKRLNFANDMSIAWHSGDAVGASSVLVILVEELGAEAVNNKFYSRGKKMLLSYVTCNLLTSVSIALF